MRESMWIRRIICADTVYMPKIHNRVILIHLIQAYFENYIDQ